MTPVGTLRDLVRYSTAIMAVLVVAVVISRGIRYVFPGEWGMWGTFLMYSLAMVAIGFFIGRDSAETEYAESRGGDADAE